MSNKKNAKKGAQPTENVQKKPTKLIIAAVAAAVIVAAVLIGIFVIKPAIDNKNPKSATTTGNGANSNIEGRYTFVDYNGTQMAKDLADILNQAEEDNRASCKKNGVAMKLGDREISTNVLGLYYLDQYRAQLYEIDYAIEQRGSNVTGYDPLVLPDEQQHLNDDYTWAEDFLYKAAETMQVYYLLFDAAIENGVSLSDNEISRLIQSYRRVYDYVLNSDETVDEYVAGVYGEGTTFAMFAAMEIISCYATKYENARIEEYEKALTDDEIEKECKENISDYQVIKSRVYAIEGEYDPIEISKINTEEEFLEFAVNNSTQDNYNADVITQNFYVQKATLESTFGAEVAEWAFDSKRVAGEVGIVQGMLYEFLVYIETPPFFSTSKDLIVYEYYLNGDESEEELEQKYYEVEALYNSWKGMSQEDFLEACTDTGHGGQKDVSTGEFYYEMNNWIMDDSRKHGDTAFFADGEGLYVVYFIENNADDFDWMKAIRTNMSVERSNSEYDASLVDYEIEYFDSAIKKVFKAANKRISENIKKSKEES